MNRNPLGSLVLIEALVGYLYFKTAEGLSDRSLESYERIIKKWMEYCGDVEIKSIAIKDITKYLTWLRSEYVPKRLNGDKPGSRIRLVDRRATEGSLGITLSSPGCPNLTSPTNSNLDTSCASRYLF